MRLELDDLAAYVRLLSPRASRDEIERRVTHLRKAVKTGRRDLADIRVARDPASGLRAAVGLRSSGGSSLILFGPYARDAGGDRAAADLVAEAVRRAREKGARIVGTRLKAGEAGPLYRTALLDAGFAALGERVEFRTPLAELPPDDDDPLEWRDLDAVGRERAAATLMEVAAGDPNTAEDEDPHAAIVEWLSAPDLTGDSACVQVGFEGDRPVAFVCAQVHPGTGWSRIAYLGVVPDRRGRGLGAVAHRRGFRMLRDQGGELYHGGTSKENAGMLRLFEKHGCREFLRLLDYEWRA